MDSPQMDKESLQELSANMTRLTALLGIEYCVQADTGKLAIYKDGSWYGLKGSFEKQGEECYPESHAEITNLIIEVEEAMTHYILIYGKLPPNLCVQ